MPTMITKRQQKRRAHALLTKTRDVGDGCVVWTGSTTRHGYGQYRTSTSNLLVHRMAYEMFFGEIPADLQVHHVCGNRQCINPFHLQLLTAREHAKITWPNGNSASAVHARQTHCQHGHPFDAENTYVNKKGHRRCRICHNNKERQRRESGKK